MNLQEAEEITLIRKALEGIRAELRMLRQHAEQYGLGLKSAE
jgi:hypothetical protein